MQDCWSPDATSRPSFKVVSERISRMCRDTSSEQQGSASPGSPSARKVGHIGRQKRATLSRRVPKENECCCGASVVHMNHEVSQSLKMGSIEGIEGRSLCPLFLSAVGLACLTNTSRYGTTDMVVFGYQKRSRIKVCAPLFQVRSSPRQESVK